MKVLWVTNMPLKEVSDALSVPGTLSQSWLVDLWRLTREAGIEVCSASVSKITEMKSIVLNGGTHYVIPVISKYMPASTYQKYWKQIIEKEKPDLIHIHGTEYRHPLPLLQMYPEIKSVLTIQGVMQRISQEFYGGLTGWEVLRYRTMKENLHLGGMIDTCRLYRKQAKNEAEIIRRVNCVTGRTLWDYSIMKSINPNLQYFCCTYNLRDPFYSAEKWNINRINRHSIYTAFSSYPLKGLHILLRAISLVKQQYPDVLLKVPGMKGDADGRLIVNSGYAKYLQHLIHELDIEENVRFLSGQSAQDVISNMQKAHVCVVSSAIEGASATLREAMHIGTPSVCSFRGGMTELLKDGLSGFYYDYNEYPYLAERIMQIFSDDALAVRLSTNVIADAEKMHDRKKNEKSWLDMYEYAMRH